MKINMLDLVFLVFLALKLAGFIDWSWWWVAAPEIGAILLLLLQLSQRP